jgi:hypothetical protein
MSWPADLIPPRTIHRTNPAGLLRSVRGAVRPGTGGYRPARADPCRRSVGPSTTGPISLTISNFLRNA